MVSVVDSEKGPLSQATGLFWLCYILAMIYSPFVCDERLSEQDACNADGLAESLGVCLSDDCAMDDIDPLTDFLLNDLYSDLRDLDIICRADSFNFIDHVRRWYAVTPRKDPHNILQYRTSEYGIYHWVRDQHGRGLFNPIAGGPFVSSFSPYINPELFGQGGCQFQAVVQKLSY